VLGSSTSLGHVRISIGLARKFYWHRGAVLSRIIGIRGPHVGRVRGQAGAREHEYNMRIDATPTYE